MPDRLLLGIYLVYVVFIGACTNTKENAELFLVIHGFIMAFIFISFILYAFWCLRKNEAQKQLTISCYGHVPQTILPGIYHVGRLDSKEKSGLLIGSTSHKFHNFIECFVPSVSREHLTLEFDGVKLKLADNGSTNGSFIGTGKSSKRFSKIVIDSPGTYEVMLGTALVNFTLSCEP